MSLSLLYHTPAPLIRSHNLLFSDHLLPALRTISIPHTSYHQEASNSTSLGDAALVSFSAYPYDDPQTASRKDKTKRFQLKTKCVEVKLAQWYLQESDWDEDEAVRRWGEDEEWEKRNPLPLGIKSGKRGSKRRVWGMSVAESDGLKEVLGEVLEEEKQREEKERKRRRRWDLVGLGSMMG